ncbi:MAG: hypothetical protein EOO70_08385, partial [Myxococcaceae bacterium]
DGKVLIGGSFTTISGTARSGLARLNPNGSLDTSFNPGTGENAMIYSLALQSDGKVLLGGAFTSINGTTRNRVGRLNADGSLDMGFDVGTVVNSTGSIWGSATPLVRALAVQSDGKVLVGGTFTSINGTARRNIVRLNASGSVDTSFLVNGPSNTVYTIALQSDGKMLLGCISGRIVRLNANGSDDWSFYADTGTNDTFNAIALQSDGKVLVGGSFSSISGKARSYLDRLDNDAATQNLSTTNSSRIEWLRGGASPEVEQVTFELSTDSGATWSLLGTGTRISGGWERTGLNLHKGLLRATGRTSGGQYNGSSGLVQTTAGFSFSAPGVTTSTNSITGSSATLRGAVNPNGAATTAYFEYGLTNAYGSTAQVSLSPVDGTTAQSVSVFLTGLQPATAYHYRLV